MPASDVWPQSFDLKDVLYWIENEPEFGAQAVYLDDTYETEGYDVNDPSTYPDSLQSLADRGVRYIAPPLWMLVTVGGGWYYQSIKDVTDNDAVTYELLDVLAQQVKVKGVFSDWPATVTYYANCMGL